MADNRIGDANAGFVAKLMDVRDVGLIGQGVERSLRQEPFNRVKRSVDQHRRLAPKIMNGGLSSPKIEISDVAPLLPVFHALQVIELEDDHIGVLAWER